jgi:hypothetical protein
MLTAPFITLLYAFIVCRASTFGKCAALLSLGFLYVLDRGLDFPQEHFRYVGAEPSRSYATKRIQKPQGQSDPRPAGR